jgi:hypothetical protein
MSAQLTAFTYQGRLNLGGVGVTGSYDLRFTVFDSTNNPGVIIAGPVTNTAASVANGLFTSTIDFGTNVFTGAALWLEIAVRTNLVGAFTTLGPRQALSGSPYAQFAFNTSANVNNTVGNTFASVGGGLDNQSTGPYATVGGGSLNISSNYASTVSGGLDNEAAGIYSVVGGGQGNLAIGLLSVIAGGLENVAYGGHSFIGSGSANTANDFGDVIGGGVWNSVSTDYSTIGGGLGNVVTNVYATIPGGYSNIVSGRYGFAAGQKAQALHDGCFVWADASSTAGFGSSGANQFLIRAFGGVGIGVNNPGEPLDVGGRIRTRDGAGTNAAIVFNTAFPPLGGTADIGWVGVMDGTRIGFFGNDPRGGSGWGLTFDTVTGNVGIGTGSTYPNYKLQVNGTVAGVGAYTSLSDARFKTNVAQIDHALELVERLRGVRYDWRTADFPAMNFEPGRQLGFIAQEIEPVLPEAVSVNAAGVRSVAYSKVIPVLVEAVKEQQDQLRQRDARIGKLERELADLCATQRQAAADWESRFTALRQTMLDSLAASSPRPAP